MASTYIFEVYSIAKAHLGLVLRDYPGMAKLVTTGADFRKWSELCAIRLNELETLNMIPNKEARVRFIHTASEAFADKKLSLAERGAKFDKTTQKITK